MYFITIIYVCCGLLTYTATSPITCEDVRGTPYKVDYDYRAIKINDVRTMLISGAIHYPRSTPGMWPYIMKMAKNQGLNTIQTYVFWNIHEQKQGVLDFSGRANLSAFLQTATDAGLFVNLRIGPYVCGEWNYGGLPVWLNQIPNMALRSNNDPWKTLMRKFILNIIDYVTPYLAKNGGPIIMAQIENEYHYNDTAYVDWCGSLVTNELSSTNIPWIMCNGLAADSTIETCNACNCLDNGWIDQHNQNDPNKPMIFTENEGWYQKWGDPLAIRTTSDLAYSVAEWFAAGGAYHAYYMWHGGNNYGRSAASAVTTVYADDVCLHSDGTPNEPKYTHLSRLQHLIAQHAKDILSQNATRVPIPWWDGQQWKYDAKQFAYSYPPSTHFIINQFDFPVMVKFHNQNLTLADQSVQIYDDNLTLLWNSANFGDIVNGNTEFFPVVSGPLEWRTWTESRSSNISKILSISPMEQLNLTNDETIYLWYRRNITLKRALQNTIVQVQTIQANAFLFFLNGLYLGEFDNHEHGATRIDDFVALDLSQFKPNEQYLFEILSISLGLHTDAAPGIFEYKGILGNVWLDGELLIDNQTYINLWEHQKGLVGEYLQIYTEQGSAQVNWDAEWIKSINKPVTWFQTTFDLDHLVREDINANPVLLDANGLSRGHAYINGNDLGLYWLIQGVCQRTVPCCCQQAQINCLEPSQRYYHIPSDWLKPKNNLITIFDDLGAPSPGSVELVQRVVMN